MTDAMGLDLVDAHGGRAAVPRLVDEPMSPMVLIEKAVAAGNLDMVEKLMTLQERWDKNRARKAFDAAIAAAKVEIPVILKNRTVDFTGKTGVRTHYRHEDLGEIARTIDPILGRHGLSYRFRTSSSVGEPVVVTCVLSHAEGHYEENSLTGPRDESGNKNPHQAIASAVTLLQRYTLKASLGLAAADDDAGQAAGNIDEPEYITAAQVKAIEDRCKAEGVNIDRLCLHLKVTAIENIMAKDHDVVIRLLNQRKAEREIKAKEGVPA